MSTQPVPDNSIKTKKLQGLRVLVTAFELEQTEHRGIAVFTKGMLKALREAGAEVWLLTEFDPSMSDLNTTELTSKTANIIYAARVLDSLNSGIQASVVTGKRKFMKRIPILRSFLGIADLIKRLTGALFPTRQFSQRSLKTIPLDQFLDNPYLRSERLGYLQDVDGLICANDLFSHSFSLARQPSGHALRLALEGFDGVITTCPLNISARNVRFMVQTIHDLIPLEYVQTGDNPRVFFRRLKACAYGGRLFVSQSTLNKYDNAIPQPTLTRPRASGVVIQPPSLVFPADACDWEARTSELSVYCDKQSHTKVLQPCRYLLFNSSVHPHKNLLFALRAFSESRVEQHGVKLCIVGKLKSTRYSIKIKNLVDSNSNMLLTGYVDEATKRQLFLNALAVVCPSLVEGFGIPVLDGACLGLPVIASPSESHQEIRGLYDFDQHVLLCSTLQTSDWASAMRLVVARMERQRLEAIAGLPDHLRAQQQGLWLDELRQHRIRRYRQLQHTIDTAFQDAIVGVIQAELATSARSA
ncbi:MAG: glycosyltransferase [Cyanobacteria bacterium]|nr:glycosyltransferase [Cyanobacteria bacterium bin.275]